MPLSKTYMPTDVETPLYQKWEDAGLFEPKVKSEAQPYTIMIPPPNVTGSLHAGHGLTMTLQDTLIRHARMSGKDTLWQPGTDHASIAVNRIVSQLLEKEGTSRTEAGRDKFLERAWAWKAESGGTITTQLRRLGASCAWQRERFTMDDGYTNAVLTAFVKLYEKGLIYRGERLVNWDPVYQSAVSDLEVRFKEVNGHLWHFKYPYADGFTYNDEKTGVSDGIVIATTRPETILADGAIAINPKDPRAKELVGKTVIVPIVDRPIPIIADDYVDPEFGSGMVKITAAHDFNDYEVYLRHKDKVEIPLINLMNPNATMNENCPEDYRGLDRFEARQKVVADFKGLGFFVKEENHPHSVPHAERDETVLEPYLTTQWYVDAKTLAKPALAAVKDGKTKFVPQNWEKTYFNWLENIEDWCISRQIWWGHRIPAWYKDGEIHVGMEAPEGDGWVQDEDVLDTWFSSGLWPFATLGWPEKTPELAKYYPGDVLVTGFDIIFFWVARMMMFGIEFMGEAPFHTVFMHALVRDEHGQKMSKSKGNVLDPLELVEKYGTDALRFTICSLTAPGQDIKLGEQKIEQGRNFCTKLWNAARYAEMNGITLSTAAEAPAATHPVNQWILGELGTLADRLENSYADYRFNDMAHHLYHTTWGTWCDWYLELTKPLLTGSDEAIAEETRDVMGWAFEKLLRLLHPVTPYITEEIWQNMASPQESEWLMCQAWPKAGDFPKNPQAQADINWLVNVIGAIRATRTELKVPHKATIAAKVKGMEESDLKRFEHFADTFAKMAGIPKVTPTQNAASDTDAVAVAEGLEIILPLEGVIDFAAEKERVAKEVAKMEAELAKINGMLQNPNFVDRAPQEVVAANQAKAAEIQADLAKLQGR